MVTEEGRVTSTSGIFWRRAAVVAPGKQRVIVFWRRICLMIESPTRIVEWGGAVGVRVCSGGVVFVLARARGGLD